LYRVVRITKKDSKWKHAAIFRFPRKKEHGKKCPFKPAKREKPKEEI